MEFRAHLWGTLMFFCDNSGRILSCAVDGVIRSVRCYAARPGENSTPLVIVSSASDAAWQTHRHSKLQIPLIMLHHLRIYLRTPKI